MRENRFSAQIDIDFASEVTNPSMFREVIAVGPAAKRSQVFDPDWNDDVFPFELDVNHIALHPISSLPVAYHKRTAQPKTSPLRTQPACDRMSLIIRHHEGISMTNDPQSAASSPHLLVRAARGEAVERPPVWA